MSERIDQMRGQTGAGNRVTRATGSSLSLESDPALSGLKEHERGHTALRGLPFEVPGSTFTERIVMICGLCENEAVAQVDLLCAAEAGFVPRRHPLCQAHLHEWETTTMDGRTAMWARCRE